MSRNWSIPEVEATIEDYFDMLHLELTGQKYNKRKHRRELMERLNGRSDSSVERKHQNISAVLTEMGIPCIAGYKPLSNYQRSILPEAISNYLEINSEFHKLLYIDSGASPDINSVDDWLSVMEEPPSIYKKKKFVKI